MGSDTWTRSLRGWTDGFVLWVLIISAAACAVPAPFASLRPWIVYGLGVIMFGMGMTLRAADFARVLRMPGAVACGVAGQFVIMPLLAVILAKGFALKPELAMGVIILGCCPGGTASNVIAYLAGADVALSVTMTACSTLLAVVLTPLLVDVLGGPYLPVDGWAMFVDVVKIVLVPLGAGLALHTAMKERLAPVLAVFPAISVLIIVLVIAAIVGGARLTLAAVPAVVVPVVLLHNAGGLFIGYGLALACRLPPPARRTVAIEVAMQNSGLGVALATAHFAASPLTALPPALFSVVHNLTGSLAATVWRRRKREGVDG